MTAPVAASNSPRSGQLLMAQQKPGALGSSFAPDWAILAVGGYDNDQNRRRLVRVNRVPRICLIDPTAFAYLGEVCALVDRVRYWRFSRRHMLRPRLSGSTPRHRRSHFSRCFLERAPIGSGQKLWGRSHPPNRPAAEKMGKAKLLRRADPRRKVRGQQVWLLDSKPRLQDDIAFAYFAIAFQKQVARLVSAESISTTSESVSSSWAIIASA